MPAMGSSSRRRGFCGKSHGEFELALLSMGEVLRPNLSAVDEADRVERLARGHNKIRVARGRAPEAKAAARPGLHGERDVGERSN